MSLNWLGLSDRRLTLVICILHCGTSHITRLTPLPWLRIINIFIRTSRVSHWQKRFLFLFNNVKMISFCSPCCSVIMQEIKTGWPLHPINNRVDVAPLLAMYVYVFRKCRAMMMMTCVVYVFDDDEFKGRSHIHGGWTEFQVRGRLGWNHLPAPGKHTMNEWQVYVCSKHLSWVCLCNQLNACVCDGNPHKRFFVVINIR